MTFIVICMIKWKKNESNRNVTFFTWNYELLIDIPDLLKVILIKMSSFFFSSTEAINCLLKAVEIYTDMVCY